MRSPYHLFAGACTLFPTALQQQQRREGTQVILMLSRFMTDTQARSLEMTFHVVVTGSVFAFLAMIILLSC